ncbi:MAG: ABC transporter permease subunit, partial [Sediminibacterium sp.]
MKKVNLLAYFFLILFAAVPLLAGVTFAISYSMGWVGALHSGTTFDNWKKVFSESDTPLAFLYSTVIALVALTLSVLIGLLTAVKYHKWFTTGILSFIIYIPLAFPGIVAAFFFFQFLTKAGFLSRIFYQLHFTRTIDQFPDLVNDFYGIGILITLSFLSFPFFVLLFTNLIKTERINEFRFLAETMGASKNESLKKIAVPILLKKALPNCILHFIFILGSFEIPLLLGRSRPEMISVLAIRKLQKFDL